MDLGYAAPALLGNPYAADRSVWGFAARRLGQPDVPEEVRKRLASGNGDAAQRLLLAAAHVAAIRAPDERPAILEPEQLTPAMLRALPRSRGDYVRVAMAAGRCHRALDRFLGSSAATQRIRRETWAACFGDSLVHAVMLAQVIHDHDVLILGETGTGKEAIALAIQDGTPGSDDGAPAPCAALNAAAVPETLIESELFGHVKGAFTGATDARTGRIRSAHRGSFFLDEVGDLPATTQVKLLRVIEANVVTPLGSDVDHVADVRYVAATHKDLRRMVDDGVYRRDLYERLAGNVIEIPPLRERPEDIVEIGTAFVDRHLPEGALSETRERVADWLRSAEAHGYPWPGNIRELQNALRNLLLGLPPGVPVGRTRRTIDDALPDAIRDCTATQAEVDDWYLARVLDHVDGNLTRAGQILAVDRTTVRRRARKRR